MTADEFLAKLQTGVKASGFDVELSLDTEHWDRPMGVDEPIEIAVHGRDKHAAALYRYLRWCTRYARRTVDPAVKQAILQRMLFGATPPVPN